MFILFTKNGYRLPGGNQEMNENIFDTVQRECNEEARIKLKNIHIQSQRIDLKIPSWVKEKIPEKDRWIGNVVTSFWAEYDSDFIGYISDVAGILCTSFIIFHGIEYNTYRQS